MTNKKANEMENNLEKDVEVRNSTRLKKLELMNPTQKHNMQIYFNKVGLSDQTYWRLRTGKTKGQLFHTKVINEMVEALKLTEV